MNSNHFIPTSIPVRFTRRRGRPCRWGVIAACVLLAGCEDSWNNPHGERLGAGSVLYASFSDRPQFMDPARSYTSTAYGFIQQVYEPPLAYHYLKRPYELVPLSAARMPEVRHLDGQGRELPPGALAEEVAYTEYLIDIKPGILYQPHPALARREDGSYRYHALTEADLEPVNALADFTQTGSRELVAEDFVYQIKRLADPRRHCPIAGIIAEYVEGFAEFQAHIQNTEGVPMDLRGLSMSGVESLSRYRYRVRLKGTYPQFIYWLAMPFFAPMPWEADVFHEQPGMAQRNLTLHWYPIGTGPYMLTENNPNLRMVLERNPNFRGEPYPDEGEPGDEGQGFLDDRGRTMPFVDRAIFSLEKENIPRWSKFLQGYYDLSGIGSDSFDQAIEYGGGGEVGLTDAMEEKGIVLRTAVDLTVFYMGFNMLDPVVGGYGERSRLLRRAISIAVDYEENISIFTNGRGIPGQGPLPPQIFGVREGEAGINPYVYRWEEGKAVRRSIEEARELMRRAGYQNGIDQETGKPLVLYFEAVGAGPDAKASLNWLRKQFAKLDIQLVIRATDYNRFRAKMRKGTGQIFQWGWHADYPDPENFLFLLYGPNAQVDTNGPNSANYKNPEYDALFSQMKNIPNGERRQQIIDRMMEILRRDAPWAWGFHPVSYILSHQWVHNNKPTTMSYNTLKYRRIDTESRAAALQEWNQPTVWPIWAGLGVLVLLIAPALVGFLRRERERGR